jgi:hypothetical protein
MSFVQAQNNASILSDVSTCLSDALDSMFHDGHGKPTSGNNYPIFNRSDDGGSSSAEALKLVMNKRKLASNGSEQQYEENGNAKRVCSLNAHSQHQQKA